MNKYITTYHSIGGWKAVHVWWNPDGFWEPYQTGLGAYRTEDEAIVEAKGWAETDDMQYVPRAREIPVIDLDKEPAESGLEELS